MTVEQRVNSGAPEGQGWYFFRLVVPFPSLLERRLAHIGVLCKKQALLA